MSSNTVLSRGLESRAARSLILVLGLAVATGCSGSRGGGGTGGSSSAGEGGSAGEGPSEGGEGGEEGGESGGTTGGSATGGGTSATSGGTGSRLDVGNGDSSGMTTSASGSEGGTGEPGGDPTTCAQAEMFNTYIGCDFWPTVTGNQVWSLFDYAVVVANAGDGPADVTVERGGMPIGGITTIPPDELRTIYLPWIPELKGPDADSCGAVVSPLASTVRVPNGAYHLVSTRPVTVYQFSALEYAPQGGPAGKSWAGCPAAGCTMATVPCYAYSNDASLLLPSTAMTNNYRITGYKGWMEAMLGGTITVTGITDGTMVTVKVSAQGALTAGGGVAATGANGILTFPINRGEVVELVGTTTTDLSGTLVQSTSPVQVISGMPCTQVPYGTTACDHIEETVFPAETLGAHYFVTVPTSPSGAPVGHLVRIYGNVDGTQLTYPTGKPDGFPDVINAGEVFEMGRAMLVVQPFSMPPYYWDLAVTTDFEIVGDHEFAVGSFQFGAQALSGGQVAAARGDPAQSLMTAVEQFRRKYVFLAPLDYPANFVDVVQPMAAAITIDGAPVGGTLTPLGGSGFGVRRVPLGPGNGGAHVMTSEEPFGIQVMGYGEYTSYQYPGGLNLDVIAPPPPPVG